MARLKQLDSAYYKVAGSGSDKEIESGGRANGFVEALVLTTKIAKSQIYRKNGFQNKNVKIV